MTSFIATVLLTFFWDASDTATSYTLYEQTTAGWIVRGHSTTTQLTLSVPKGTHLFAVSASNSIGESPLSSPLKLRIKQK